MRTRGDAADAACMSGHHANPLVSLAAALQHLQGTLHTIHQLLQHRACSLLARCKQAGVVFALRGRLCVMRGAS